jgi:hypothetical protein
VKPTAVTFALCAGCQEVESPVFQLAVRLPMTGAVCSISGTGR